LLFHVCAGAHEEIPLLQVKSNILGMVIEFCKHHVDQKLPEIEKVSALRFLWL
jgi:hypothetical protein